MDVMWLDIEHTDGKKYFTWDSRKFPGKIKFLFSYLLRGSTSLGEQGGKFSDLVVLVAAGVLGFFAFSQ